MRSIPKSLAINLAICVLVTSCGGGGGGGGNTPIPTPTPTPTPTPPPTPTPTPTAPTTFTLSGTITASSSQAVDSDTNDPTRVAVPNDTPATAQEITNPITLGGYVNQPGGGAEGRSQTEGDTDDYFRVELLEGQTITLLVADFEQSDADLYLYDTGGSIIDFSIDTGDVETLIAPSDGTFIINPFAFSGGTNYILAIGAPGTAPTAQASRAEIVPWQAVVKYQDAEEVSAAAMEQGFTRSLALEQRAGGHGRARLMAMRQGQLEARQTKQRRGSAHLKLAQLQDPQLRARWETLLTIKSLRKEPGVQYAEPNYKVRAFAAPNDQGYPSQWHYPLIGLPEAWETTTGNPNVLVAVVDTGVLINHPDLAGQLVPGYDFVRDVDSARDGNGIDSNPDDPGSSTGGSSSSFHGTHTTGTIAARGNNTIGVAGSAYSSRVMPLRALGADGGGTSYDVDQAIRFAAGLANDSGTVPAQRADIINLSLGGGGFSQSEQQTFNAVRAAGVMVVAAAGNEASSSPSYPAAYNNVISVSAVDSQRRLAPYSNTGSQVDVAAPGGNSGVDLNGDGFPDGVLSTDGSSSGTGINFVYSFLNGTSMAAPHVAGVLALMKSVNADLTPEDVDVMLTTGLLSDDLGAPGRDDLFGYGIINAQSAVLAALEATGTSPADNPRLVSSISTLNFGATTTELELVLRNGGKGDLSLDSLSASQPWLQVTPNTVDANGLGTYRVNVDRSSLAVGIFSADITAQSSVNNLAVRVLISAGTAGATTDVGVIYILLYDPIANEPVQQAASSGNGAEYPFEFTGIEAGEYEIIAGSDADNDLLICDAGEACGAWLTTDQPIRLQIDSNTNNLDFPIEYLVSLPSLAAQAQEKNKVPTKEKGRRRAVDN